MIEKIPKSVPSGLDKTFLKEKVRGQISPGRRIISDKWKPQSDKGMADLDKWLPDFEQL